jgi:starch synthase
VHATGGLIDTVIDCNAATLAQGTASGFVFDRMDATSLLSATRRAAQAYKDNQTWTSLQQNCMKKDFGWHKSAKAYRHIYAQLMRE